MQSSAPAFRPFLVAKKHGNAGSIFRRLSHFRPPTCEFRERLRSQISMSLANLIDCFLFWSPSRRRLYARSAGRRIEDLYLPSRGRGGALPGDAWLVGRYTHPAPVGDVLEDVLAAARQPAPPPPAPDPAPAPILAAPKAIPPTTWHWARRPFNTPLGKRDE